MISNKQPKGKTGKLKAPAGNFGSPLPVNMTIPAKPTSLGPKGTHGSYSKGSKPGTVFHK